MYPSDLTEGLFFFFTYFAYQYRRPQIEIPFYFRRLLFDGFSLQWCWLWVKWKCHQRLSRGCSEGSLLRQRQTSLYSLTSFAWEIMNHRTQRRGHMVTGGWMSVWRGASQSVCDNLTLRFLPRYSQAIITLSQRVTLRLVRPASVQVTPNEYRKTEMTHSGKRINWLINWRTDKKYHWPHLNLLNFTGQSLVGLDTARYLRILKNPMISNYFDDQFTRIFQADSLVPHFPMRGFYTFVCFFPLQIEYLLNGG